MEIGWIVNCELERNEMRYETEFYECTYCVNKVLSIEFRGLIYRTHTPYDIDPVCEKSTELAVKIIMVTGSAHDQRNKCDCYYDLRPNSV